MMLESLVVANFCSGLGYFLCSFKTYVELVGYNIIMLNTVPLGLRINGRGCLKSGCG